jgi:hypothetical protein
LRRLALGNSHDMGLLDPTLRMATRLGLGLAGSLIGEVQRRGPARAHRTPDRLLLEDAEGMPGPALVGPIAYHDTLLLPVEIDRTQAKELALAAARVALHGAARHLLRVGEALLRPDREQADEGEREDAPSVSETAERAAWERFVVALERLTELQSIHAVDPDDVTAEDVIAGEIDLEDAVAVAGEFGVKKIRWLLT